MLKQKLKNHNLILASGSPRRQYFFKELDLDFTIDVRPVEETFPSHLERSEVTDHLSKLKASVFADLNEKDILITSDTIVWKDGSALNKPQTETEAYTMLQNLSNSTHEVYTSVTFTSKNYQKTVNDCTKVWFNKLNAEEINHYIQTYKPYDRAGSYGIQDWIGYIGVEKIKGCFFNVMGLPTRLVYKTLMNLADH